jgi:hypothetical protein
MNIARLHRSPTGDGPLRHAIVVHVGDDGCVDVETATGERWRCEVLHPVAALPSALHEGDRVLVLPPEGDAPGCVLGTLGPARVPAVLRIEAGQELHLVCGEGSVHLRADGRVVVRGLEVASIAAGVNRIKGGSVEVN